MLASGSCRYGIRLFSTRSVLRSGHNKWSTIKHDKAKNDALKNQIATKHAKSIAVATKLGGPDTSINFQLATAIDLANKANVSKKVIENAIKRGSGVSSTGEQTQSDLAVYEGMVDGVSFVVEALTDNKARSASHIKVCFTKLSGNFAPTMFMFNKRGYIKVAGTVDEVMDIAIESGAEDIDGIEDEYTMVFTQPQDTNKCVTSLREHFKVEEFGLEYAPNEDTAVPADSLSDERKQTLDKLVRNLENIDDVTKVYSNVVS